MAAGASSHADVLPDPEGDRERLGLRVLRAELPQHGLERLVREPVPGVAGHAGDRGDRRQPDEETRWRIGQRVAEVERTGELGRGLGDRLVDGRLVDPPRHVRAGAVDDGRDRAELLAHLRDERCDGIRIGDVAAEVARRQALGLEALERGGRFLLGRAPRERERGPGGSRDAEGALGGDAACAAGDEHDVAGRQRTGTGDEVRVLESAWPGHRAAPVRVVRDRERLRRRQLGDHVLGACPLDDAHAQVVSLVVEARCKRACERGPRGSCRDVRDHGGAGRRRGGAQPADRGVRSVAELRAGGQHGDDVREARELQAVVERSHLGLRSRLAKRAADRVGELTLVLVREDERTRSAELVGGRARSSASTSSTTKVRVAEGRPASGSSAGAAPRGTPPASCAASDSPSVAFANSAGSSVPESTPSA